MPRRSEEITVLEAAAILELTPRAVQLMIQRGELPARRAQPWRKRSPYLIKLSDVEKMTKPDDPKLLALSFFLIMVIVTVLPRLI